MKPFIAPEDIRLSQDIPHLLSLFSLLGYHTDPDPLPLDKQALEFSPADSAVVRRVVALARQTGSPDLRIILLEVEKEGLNRLRSLAKNFLDREGNYLLVVTPDPADAYRRLVFVNPRREAGQIKIRKLVVERTHPTRHDVDVLSQLAVNGRSALDLYLAHCAAFDIERITSRFYQEYAQLFQHVRQTIQQHNPGHQAFYDPIELKTYTQRFLGRLMFLYFIQKKGWLGGNGRFLTTHYQRLAQEQSNYYQSLLKPLFFDTLNQLRPDNTSPWGKIPYLNGGLFEADSDQNNQPIPDIYLPNELFDPGDSRAILGFFNNYNFTVAEETPIEQEVAVDPEMLGKVFENMMEEEERGSSGTFYTPRTIVHYMCREALLGYLQDKTGLDRALLKAQFEVAELEPEIPGFFKKPGILDSEKPGILKLSQSHQVEEALQAIRVLDPAVGTGAFLVGLLQELIGLKRACWLARDVFVPRSSPQVAEWKRHFISHALHGVDIKKRAIEIARLRLWLSLVVDITSADNIEPLPNLDYKLMSGDSLIESFNGEPILKPELTPEIPGFFNPEIPGFFKKPGILSEKPGILSPFPTQNQQIGLPGLPTPPIQLQFGMGQASDARDVLDRLKQAFFKEQNSQKRRQLRDEVEAQERAFIQEAIAEKLKDIASKISGLVAKGSQVNWKGLKKEQKEMEKWVEQEGKLVDLQAKVRRGEPLPFFLYRLHFFDVFRDHGGFDVVIANPPYVDHRLIKEQRPNLELIYPQVYEGRADLYIYFYARGLDLLRANGLLAFIAPNKFMRANYGGKLRRLLSQESALQEVIDFGDLPVFDATTYPCIVITRKAKPAESHAPQMLAVTDMESLPELGKVMQKEGWAMPQLHLKPEGWQMERPEVLALLQKLQDGGTLLTKVINGQLYRGIATGYDEAFVIDEITRQKLIDTDPNSINIIKPWIRGRDIKRWYTNSKNLYLIFCQRGISISDYPAIREFLSLFRERLEKRATSHLHPWYELQQPQTGIFQKFENPKIICPKYGLTPAFSHDIEKNFLGNTAFFLPTKDLALLGVLNSTWIEWYARQTFNLVRGGYIEWIPANVEKLPIPSIPKEERPFLETLVNRLLELKGQGEEAAALEAELNDRVYRLFALTPAEIRLIESRTRNLVSDRNQVSKNTEEDDAT